VCLELPLLENGMISYNPEMDAPYSAGTVATYTCNPGFELDLTDGDEQRTCTDTGGVNGEFDGDMPRCVRKS